MARGLVATDNLEPREWHGAADFTPRVVITDRDDLDRAAYVDGLGTLDGVEVVGSATTSDEAIRQCLATRADVLLLDSELPPCGGYNAAWMLSSRGCSTSVLIVGEEIRVAPGIDLLSNWDGGLGLITRSAVPSMSALAQAIRIVASGERVVAPELLRQVVGAPAQERRYGLTPREWSVLVLVSSGLNDTSIASRLGLSKRTVENVVWNIKQKLEPELRPDHHTRVRLAMIYLDLINGSTGPHDETVTGRQPHPGDVPVSVV